MFKKLLALTVTLSLFGGGLVYARQYSYKVVTLTAAAPAKSLSTGKWHINRMNLVNPTTGYLAFEVSASSGTNGIAAGSIVVNRLVGTKENDSFVLDVDDILYPCVRLSTASPDGIFDGGLDIKVSIEYEVR